MTKTKKTLLIAGLTVDILVTVFLFVLSIIMLVTMPNNGSEMRSATLINGPFIGWFQEEPTRFLLICVVPLFILLGVNVVALFMYLKKTATKKASLSDLSEDQKAALRAQLLKEMNGEQEEK